MSSSNSPLPSAISVSEKNKERESISGNASESLKLHRERQCNELRHCLASSMNSPKCCENMISWCMWNAAHAPTNVREQRERTGREREHARKQNAWEQKFAKKFVDFKQMREWVSDHNEVGARRQRRTNGRERASEQMNARTKKLCACVTEIISQTWREQAERATWQKQKKKR